MADIKGVTGSLELTIGEFTQDTPGHYSTFNPIWQQLLNNAAELAKRDVDHDAASDVHGATSAATPSKIVARDALGRFKAANPAAADDVDTQGARDTAINAAINGLINGAPGALDTLIELANAMGNDPNFAATVTNALALRAPLDSPALTGLPTAPTAAPGTNTTQLATTAFVTAAVSLARKYAP